MVDVLYLYSFHSYTLVPQHENTRNGLFHSCHFATLHSTHSTSPVPRTMGFVRERGTQTTLLH
nr:MAG TPA: hypothetical protein [Caudoviricetes sp.]